MPSTVISAFTYHPGEQQLMVTFVTGRRYVYHGVPQHIYQQLCAAFSKGTFFNRVIRNHFTYTEMV